MSPTDGPLNDDGGLSVGQSLRELRLARRLTLKSVSTQADISESFLSQIERGKASPSLRLLFRIAAVYGLTPGDLLMDQFAGTPALIQKQARPIILTEHYTKQRLIPHTVRSVEVLAGLLEPYVSVGSAYTHGDSDELLFIVRGNILAEVDGQDFSMTTGDSLHYRSSAPHTLTNVGEETAEVMWIIAPPT